MEARKCLLFGVTIACFLIPCIRADSFIVISKRYSNNSYSCFVRHTKDGLEYRLTYNVCILEPSVTNSTEPSDQMGLQCLYYECTITATQLMGDDGQLKCVRYAYPASASYPPMFDRIISYRQNWPVSKFTIPSQRREHRRRKRDFSWVAFLEKISFMGRHQSTVSKQNEAFFQYNYMNKPGGSLSPTAASGSTPSPQTASFTTGEPLQSAS
ncbi:uncharacterized protein LOC128719404 [Anopheles marshallii]|uniref:uncharacterized protein LOC128719404 n=1 Tax=Anopheles marshallii TaxID=1521116 RepID=UPI00237B1B14|nr:uncharacterized protein LOC128719404 [Anopheles marshallii]